MSKFISMRKLMFICVVFLMACSAEVSKKEIPIKNRNIDPIMAIEAAHKKSEFLNKEAIQFDIVLSFGGTERLNGQMTLTSNSAKGIIKTKTGDTLIWNHDEVFHNEEYNKPNSARFIAYTWSYFALFPYKLSDAGTKWSEFGKGKLLNKELNTQKLTFDAGTGDAPDDWYIAYSDPTTSLIEVAAYIVTSGGTVEEAEEDPHAIQYSNYQEVSGIPVAMSWTFWEWREGQDMTKELGEASISNVRFVKGSDEIFQVPSRFLEK